MTKPSKSSSTQDGTESIVLYQAAFEETQLTFCLQYQSIVAESYIMALLTQAEYIFPLFIFTVLYTMFWEGDSYSKAGPSMDGTIVILIANKQQYRNMDLYLSEVKPACRTSSICTLLWQNYHLSLLLLHQSYLNIRTSSQFHKGFRQGASGRELLPAAGKLLCAEQRRIKWGLCNCVHSLCGLHLDNSIYFFRVTSS